MAKNLLNRYIWIIDTLLRYGELTREEINELWIKSHLSDGEPICRRTFYNYRMAIEELFQINIEHNPSTYTYRINTDNANRESAINWILNSFSVGNLVNDMGNIGDRIFFEDVPSSRQHLSVVSDALKENKTLKFSYHPYSRVSPKHNIKLEPYFLKIFKQRWYITGRNTGENTLKTYALDRMSNIVILNDTFSMPEDFDAEEYFKNSYGIIFDEGDVKEVSISTDPRQAKYFRSVPLHHSQEEVIHDTYSIFHYKIKLTPDFIQELLSYGPKITVLNPPELRAMMVDSLTRSLRNYNK